MPRPHDLPELLPLQQFLSKELDELAKLDVADNNKVLKRVVAGEYHLAKYYLDRLQNSNLKNRTAADLANAIIVAEQAYADMNTLYERGEVKPVDFNIFKKLLKEIYSIEITEAKTYEYAGEGNKTIASKYNPIETGEENKDPVDLRYTPENLFPSPRNLNKLQHKESPGVQSCIAELAIAYRGFNINSDRTTPALLSIRYIPIIKLHQKLAEEYSKQGDSTSADMQQNRATYLSNLHGIRMRRRNSP